MTDRVNGGGRGGPGSSSGLRPPPPVSRLRQQAAATMIGDEMWEATGYRVTMELVMGHWMVTVRCRFLNEELETEWSDVLAFQTMRHDWSDPVLEAQSLCMQVARRLE